MVTKKVGTFSGNPMLSKRDYLRLRLNDMEEPFNFSDLEIDAELSMNPPLKAAHHLATAMVAKFSSKPSTSIAGSSVNIREVVENWRRLAEDFLTEFRQDNMSISFPAVGKVADSIPENFPTRLKPVDIELQSWDNDSKASIGPVDVNRPARLEHGV